MSTLLYHILLLCCVSLISATVTCEGPHQSQVCTLGNDSAGILDEFPPEAYKAYTLYANNQREILDISSTAFDNFVTLGGIFLNDNSLRTVSAAWFKNLRLLTYLNVSGNFISSLNDRTFSQCRQVHTLDLSRNLIEDFRYLSNDLRIADVILSKNPLKRFEIGRVDRLYMDETNLTELHLQNDVNDIIASNSRISSFSAPSTLEVLSLAENNLSDITNITALNRLVRLDLSGNNIGTPSPDAFLNLHELDTLNLSDTNIRYLYYGLFANQMDLRVLDLSENKISHFNTNHIRRTRGNKTLAYLDLHSNPIKRITDDGILLKNLRTFYLGGDSSSFDCLNFLDLYTTNKNIQVLDYLKRFDVDNVDGIGCHDSKKIINCL